MKYPIVICICMLATFNLLGQGRSTYTDSLLLRFDSLLIKRLNERDIKSKQLENELKTANENARDLAKQIIDCQNKADSLKRANSDLRGENSSTKSKLVNIESNKQSLENEYRLSIQNQLEALVSAPSNFPDVILIALEKQVDYFNKQNITLTGAEIIQAFRDGVSVLSKADSLLNFIIHDVKDIEPTIQAMDKIFNNQKMRFLELHKEYETQKKLLEEYKEHLQDVRCRILEIAIVKEITLEEKQEALDYSGFNLRTMDGYGFIQKKLDEFYKNPNVDNMNNIKGLVCE